jgi:alpha-N-acetylgalactosaminidase
MGWLSWSRFRCYKDCDADPDNCLSERLLKTVADHLVNDGYRDAGYTAINLDSCWWDGSKPRDAAGHLQADPKRFPSGMTALASYMAERGLMLGTCAPHPMTSMS